MKLLAISVNFDLDLPDHVFSSRQIVKKEWMCNGSLHRACINWATTDVPPLLEFCLRTRIKTCSNGKHNNDCKSKIFVAHNFCSKLCDMKSQILKRIQKSGEQKSTPPTSTILVYSDYEFKDNIFNYMASVYLYDDLWPWMTFLCYSTD
jgi:hypothetical protein